MHLPSWWTTARNAIGPGEGMPPMPSSRDEDTRNEEVDKTIDDLRALTASLDALDLRVRRMVGSSSSKHHARMRADKEESSEEDDEEGDTVVTPTYGSPLRKKRKIWEQKPSPPPPPPPAKEQVWWPSGGWYMSGIGWPTLSGIVFLEFPTPNRSENEISASTSCIFCGGEIRKIEGAAPHSCDLSSRSEKTSIVSWWGEDVAQARWRGMLEQSR